MRYRSGLNSRCGIRRAASSRAAMKKQGRLAARIAVLLPVDPVSVTYVEVSRAIGVAGRVEHGTHVQNAGDKARSAQFGSLVPQARLERARPCEHQILSLARLPVPPLGLSAKAAHHNGRLEPVNALGAPRKKGQSAAGTDPRLGRIARVAGPRSAVQALPKRFDLHPRSDMPKEPTSSLLGLSEAAFVRRVLIFVGIVAFAAALYVLSDILLADLRLGALRRGAARDRAARSARAPR